MLSVQNNINFTSRILPSDSLKATFWNFQASNNILRRRKFINMLDSLINDGSRDTIELKTTKVSANENVIQTFINGEKSGVSCQYNKNNKLLYACSDAVYGVIERLQKRRTSIRETQKFGLRKMKELYNNIFG